MDPKQKHCTASRWLQILWLTIVATPFAMCLESAAAGPLSGVFQTLGTLSAWKILVASFAVACVACRALMSLVSLRREHLANSGSYPTVWLVALAGVPLVWLFVRIGSSFGFGGRPSRHSPADWLASYLILAQAVLAAMIMLRWQRRGLPDCVFDDARRLLVTIANRRPEASRDREGNGSAPAPDHDPRTDAPPDLPALSSDAPALLSWIEQEAPIEDPSQDILGRRAVARRLARLVRLPLGEDVDIGLCGAMGSGKSSVVSMLEHDLKSPGDAGSPDVWVCKVSCWGFSDSKAATEHVLDKAVKTIEEHACVSALLGLSKAYREAISGAAGWSAAAVHLLGGAGEPEEQLEKLSPILNALRARLVLVVEDLERNTSPGFDPEHVQALLHRLKEVGGVSFILVGKPRVAEIRLDYQKLCDHIEDLPWMDHAVVRSAIVTLRKHWLGAASYIDPDPKRQQFDDSDLDRLSRVQLSDHLYPWKSLVDLVRTPRAFKHCLSATDRAWESLRGEIDLDDLLICNVLRHSAPEGFEFLLENSDAIRGPRSTS